MARKETTRVVMTNAGMANAATGDQGYKVGGTPTSDGAVEPSTPMGRWHNAKAELLLIRLGSPRRLDLTCA